jgi:hypothetical protein
MSDPLTRLGSLGARGAPPDLDAIKLRAHRIQRRRQTGLASAGAAAMAIVAVVGVLLTTGPEGEKATQTLADELRESAAPSPAAQAYAPLTTVPESASAGKVVGGSSTSGSSGSTGSAPVARSETDSGEAAALAPSRASADKEPLVATVAVEDQMLGRGKTFTLKVCNATSEPVKRSFGSSQRYDFEVSQGGKVVWRWSDGQFFTQVVGEEAWKAKECKEWSADWDATTSDGGRAPAGDYKAVGVLKSSPEVRSAPKSFSLSAL